MELATLARTGRSARVVGLLGLAAITLAGCVSGSATAQFNQTTFGDIIWAMIVFFFWFMFIWMFIAIFSDIIRRNDLSGGMKAVWILVIVILPFLGILIYIVTRPKMTAQDVQMITQAEAAGKAAASVSTADELAKLQQLRQSGALTEEEFQALKTKLMG
jgi:hypothetical protein